MLFGLFGSHSTDNGVISSSTSEKETTTVTTTTTPIDNVTPITGRDNASAQPVQAEPASVPIYQFFNDQLRQSIVAYMHTSLNEEVRRSLVIFTESVMADVIEEEVTVILRPRFEAMYEGVIAQVIQKFLLNALASRAQSTLSELTKPQ